MNILGLDTSMRACSAALLCGSSGSSELHQCYEERDRGHAEAIMPMVEQIMAGAGLDYDALDRIAVTTGPGTFTGVRVGVAAARGLALATGAQMTGIPSLEVIAKHVREVQSDPEVLVAVASDARRGQVYFALYDDEEDALCPPCVLSPDNAAHLLPTTGNVILAGTGSRLVASAARGRSVRIEVEAIMPDAATLVRMAAARPPDSAPVEPLYLRPPDAKPQAGKTVARQ